MELTFAFGPFRLFPARRTLFEGEKQVRLGSRALDILISLVEHAGEVQAKDELIARVWPDVIVEEVNLRTHIAALRRAMNDGVDGRRYVVNIPGRGYSFVAPVSSSTSTAPAAGPLPSVPAHDVPAALTRMIGRSDFVDSVTAELPLRRFVTIVGAGGIGKTTVALAVADALAAVYPDGISFIDLAPIGDAGLVVSAVASALGLAVASGDVASSLIAYLRERRMLIVLDSCEHVLQEAATLAERIFQRAPGVHVLATSREPLRAEGERVRRLPSLAVAPETAGISAGEALAFPAIQLFVERVAANMDSFELNDADAPIVGQICRKLDGIPLAIELVAGRVETFGVSGLAALLADRFSLPASGRRTATPRHQTMSAAIEWSYNWLLAPERMMLRRLAVFAGGFRLKAVRAVLADVEAFSADIVECLENLVGKSLVTADVHGAHAVYRLLDTTRAYGLEKLAEGDELDDATHRHAEYFLRLFSGAEADWGEGPMPEWLEIYGRQIDNLRTALDWAFSAKGDPSLGIALTIAAAPLWFQLSLADESAGRYEQAIACLDAHGTARQKMQLLALRSCVISNTTIADGRARFYTVLELAETLNDDDHKALSLWGLWASHSIRGENDLARQSAEKFAIVAEATADPGYLATSDRMFASLSFNGGDVAGTRIFLDSLAGRDPPQIRRAKQIRRHMASFVDDRSMQAWVLFLQGFADQAGRLESDNFAQLAASGHAVSQVNLLRQSACAVALYAGDLDTAELFTQRLIELSTTHQLGISAAMGRCYRGMLLNLQGDAANGLPALAAAIDEFRATGFAPFLPLILSSFAEYLGQAGRTVEADAAIDEALERTALIEQRWYQAELLRVKGRLHFLAGRIPEAEDHLQQALDMAHRQGALTWELRAARSLAELRRAQQRATEGRALLSSVYDRFTEGFETADMRAARGFLDELS